ncbi:hypothetical protein C8Q79DRAFT_519574 [Trametes meyenii]|nr:hypothetical protein C8Q79DRAFT_519574 [Trametes meyenii]
MSYGASFDKSAFIEDTISLMDAECLLLSSLCLFYYDYFITLTAEIRTFWGLRLNFMGISYFLIRYGFLVHATIDAFLSARFTNTSGPYMTPNTCLALNYIVTILNLLNFASVSAFVATRMYAISGGSRSLAVCLFILGLFNPTAVMPTSLLGLKIIPSLGSEGQCKGDIGATGAFVQLIIEKLPIAASSVSITYELVCLLLTAWKTVGIYRTQRQLGHPAKLTSLLLRDGSIYFSVMAALAILNIISASIPGSPESIQIDTVLGRAFTPILTTRFMIHLRQLDSDSYADTSNWPSNCGSLDRRWAAQLMASVNGSKLADDRLAHEDLEVVLSRTRSDTADTV